MIKIGQIHTLEKKFVLSYLQSRDSGLNDSEISERLREVGPNSIEVRDPWKILRIFFKQFTNFFTILLFISAGICFAAHSIQPGESMNVLGYALTAVSLLNAFFSFFQEYRAERAMEALKKFLPSKVALKRGGEITEADAAGIVPGDILVLKEGDRVPADARIIYNNNMLVNNAPLTGESKPVSLTDEATKGRIEESNNIVFAGCSVMRGYAEAVVFATGLRTEFGKLARLSQAIKRASSPLEKETAHMVRVLTVIATLMGLTFFAYGSFKGNPIWVNLVFMMGIIVANVPEGLLPTFTLSLAMGSLRMAKKNVLVKSLNAVESLGAVHVICTDKTGTLTENRLSLSTFTIYNGKPMNREGASQTLRFSRYASEVMKTTEGLSGDPIDILIEEEIKNNKLSLYFKTIKYFPFDSGLRHSAGIIETGNKYYFVVKGAWEVIKPMLGSAASAPDLKETVKTDKSIIEKTESTMISLAQQGLRVLCCAYSEISKKDLDKKKTELEKSLIFLGFLGIEDPVRPEVPHAVSQCKSAGIDVILISGDHPETAINVARKCHIITKDDDRVILGSGLEKLTQEKLIEELKSGVRIFARSTPEQKMKIVSALQVMEKVTAMTGDGVNDAPALKAADVGIAMGLGGTDVARESAQIILLDDNFASIVSGIEEGRTVFGNIRKFTNYVLVSNGPEILPYLIYMLFPVPLAMTVIQILSIDLGTDIIPSMALGQEPPDPDEMKKSPRISVNNLLDPRLIIHSYLFLGLLEGLWSLSLFFWVLIAGGWTYGDRMSPHDPLYRSATGIALSTILLMQIGNLIGRRFQYRSGLDKGIFKNKLIVAGIIIQIVFSWAVLYFPPMNAILQTGPVNIHIYLLSWAGIFLIFGSDSIRKKIALKIRSSKDNPDLLIDR